MNAAETITAPDSAISRNAAIHFEEHRRGIHRRTDRLFAGLLLVSGTESRRAVCGRWSNPRPTSVNSRRCRPAATLKP